MLVNTFKNKEIRVDSPRSETAILLDKISKLISDSGSPDNTYKTTVPGGTLEVKRDKHGFTLSHLIEHFEHGKGPIFSETHLYRWSKDGRFCGSSTYFTDRAGIQQEQEGLSEPFAISKLKNILELANNSEIDLSKYKMGS